MIEQWQLLHSSINKLLKNYLKKEYEHWMLSDHLLLTLWSDQEGFYIKICRVSIYSWKKILDIIAGHEEILHH